MSQTRGFEGAVFCLIMGGTLFVKGFRKLKLQKHIQALATSRIRSLAMGTVELSGRSYPLRPLTDPIYSRPCSYYSIKVQEQRGSGKRRHWVTIADLNSFNQPFLLEDETGRVIVIPNRVDHCLPAAIDTSYSLFKPSDLALAAFMAQFKRALNTLRVQAYIVRPDEPLFLLGHASPLQEAVEVAPRTLTLAEVARRLKGDRTKMAALDTNKDGNVDEKEWEVGLATLQKELAAKGIENLGTGITPIPGGDLVFARSQEDLSRRLSWFSLGGVLGGAALIVLGVVMLAQLFGR